jgi:site-specific DNA-methyltransferase (adenine-specific)
MTVTLICGDCLDVLPGLASGSVDAVVTDPPYGCGKAEWDDLFPQKWYAEARRLAPMVVIITGSEGIKDSVPLVGADYVDTIAARNLNGMTRSAAGFGNWLAAVVAGRKPPQGVTFFEFAVRGEMPPHPSPKPIEFMRKLVARLCKPGQTILDPFMGSGQTGIAAVELGCNFIGIEKDPHYFAIAQRRIEQAQAQPALFQVNR